VVRRTPRPRAVAAAAVLAYDDELDVTLEEHLSDVGEGEACTNAVRQRSKRARTSSSVRP